MTISPQSTCLGILGGGQLGRMTALAARRLGLRVVLFEPHGSDCPAAAVADQVVTGAWDEPAAIDEFCRLSTFATLEFENVPLATADRIAQHIPLHPDGRVLKVCQNRELERGFLRRHGFSQPDFRMVRSTEELTHAVAELGVPCVLKTVAFGYDGKGQRVLRAGEDYAQAWQECGGSHGIVEQFVDFECELSVICARAANGRISAFPVPENVHTGGILDYSILPGRFDSQVASDAIELAGNIAESLGVVGMLAVELFLTREGTLLVNELAPRPHNSGHATFDACLTSQFEQHARVVCGYPLGDPELLKPCVMVNLLGDLWQGGEPDWQLILNHPQAKLHLYQKSDPQPGRKMGHFCMLSDDVEAALDSALKIKDALAG